MTFNSLLFFAFLALVLAWYYSPLPRLIRRRGLLLASYVFYGYACPLYTPLLAIATAIDWQCGKRVAQQRAYLWVSLVLNLGMLGFFKYYDFAVLNVNMLIAQFGGHWRLPEANLILPIGISFYTFQSLSYTIDISRGQHKPYDSLLDFSLYVSFFPQLVAGPIVRAWHFLEQLRSPVPLTWQSIHRAIWLVTIGLFQKVALADSLLAPIVDAVYGDSNLAGSIDVVIATLAFSAQIFFDFAGYSLIAVGVALLFGIRLPNNFHSPYGAVGFVDFWRRWHVTLSTWIRDYVYVSLGGNRRGTLRTAVNLLVTMLLGGLWHGASWLFVIWGLIHGGLLALEHGVKRWVPSTIRRHFLISGWLITFLMVTLAWMPFRAASFEQFGQMLSSLLEPASRLLLTATDIAQVLWVVAILVAVHLWQSSRWAMRYEHMPVSLKASGIAVMWWAIMVADTGHREFIYFQF